MRYKLEDYVMWQEFRDIAGVPTDFLRSSSMRKIKLGNVSYLEIASITDPLLRLEAKNCTNLTKFYPLSVFTRELGITKCEYDKIVKSEHSYKLCGVTLFKIPDKIFDTESINKRYVINLISAEDKEEGYETVVKITNKFKLGRYTL